MELPDGERREQNSGVLQEQYTGPPLQPHQMHLEKPFYAQVSDLCCTMFLKFWSEHLHLKHRREPGEGRSCTGLLLYLFTPLLTKSVLTILWATLGGHRGKSEASCIRKKQSHSSTWPRARDCPYTGLTRHLRSSPLAGRFPATH